MIGKELLLGSDCPRYSWLAVHLRRVASFSFGESPRQTYTETISEILVVHTEMVRATDMGRTLTASATEYHP